MNLAEFTALIPPEALVELVGEIGGMKGNSGPSIEQRLRAVIESSPSGLLAIDSKGTILLVNREIERLFGYKREELLGKSVDLLVPQRFRERHPQFRESFLNDPRARLMGAGRDLLGLRKDGTEIAVEIGLNPMETEEGVCVLSSIVDASARKQSEEQRLRLEEQLRQAQKMEAIGTLAGGIAHDFNNILGAIIGYAELAHLSAADQPAALQDLEEIIKSAERGKELVERILTFSRHHELLRYPLDLGRTVKEAVQLLRATLPANIEIRINIEAQLPRVAADATSIHQVVMNLATNSAHAMAHGGVLEISVKNFYVHDSAARALPGIREGYHALLEVRDTGPGMDRNVLEHAFEPFFTTKPQGIGSGLGLAMVHGIMREHKGAVAIESELGQGTSVRCYFPFPLSIGPEAVKPIPDTSRGNGERILYIDDEPALAALGGRRLSMLGYSVTTLNSAEQALKVFKERPNEFDLAIVDYLMPKLSGLELAQRLRQVRPDLPIVMLTGFIENMPAETLRESGVSELLKKPVTMYDLGAAANRVLRKHKKSKSAHGKQ